MRLVGDLLKAGRWAGAGRWMERGLCIAQLEVTIILFQILAPSVQFKKRSKFRAHVRMAFHVVRDKRVLIYMAVSTIAYLGRKKLMRQVSKLLSIYRIT
jgi:hypothetical protein